MRQLVTLGIPGLAGKTPMEEAQVDSIFDTYKDFIAEVRPYFLVAGENYPGDKVGHLIFLIHRFLRGRLFI